MQIEIKPKRKVEYQGESRNGRILTIEKQGKGYMVRSYQIKSNDLLKEPLDWIGALKVFRAIMKKLEKTYVDFHKSGIYFGCS